jgi:SAM-dependent methyltransferase
MHAEAWSFLSKQAKPLNIDGVRVLEFGSHDVNGSPSLLFYEAAEYFGVDPWPGRGVDWVGLAQDYDGGGRFDVVITAEAMEHDADAKGQIDSAWRALKPGGVLLLTAAADPRLPHRCDGFEGDMSGEYYGNIDPVELAGWLDGWQSVEITHNTAHGDVYARAVKPCD